MTTIDINYLWMGIGSFILFFFFAIAVRIGGYPNPWRDINRIHLRILSLYLVMSAVYAHLNKSPFDGLAWVIGLYTYMALHYAAFLHFFAVIGRSFSLNICVTAYEHGSKVPLSVITQSFANGKGVDYVKNERLEVMRGSGTIYLKDGTFHLAPFGRKVAKLNRLVLKVWGLDYLGKDRKGS